MNKLVRDAIPAMMHTENQAPIYRTLSGGELQRALLEKLKEEADEALAALNSNEAFVEELADISEVVDALQSVRGIADTELTTAKEAKRAKRGGFDSAYYIETITLDDTSEWAGYYRDRPLQYYELLPASKDKAQQFTLPEFETGLYRHYKGNYYDAIGIGCHTETGEMFVVYKALYRQEQKPDIWVRPYQDFIQTVEKNGQIVPRFQKV